MRGKQKEEMTAEEKLRLALVEYVEKIAKNEHFEERVSGFMDGWLVGYELGITEGKGHVDDVIDQMNKRIQQLFVKDAPSPNPKETI